MLQLCSTLCSQVPYETLNRKFRNAQKTIDREVSHVKSAADQLTRVLNDDPQSDSVSELLSNMVEKLKVLKRKVCCNIQLISTCPLHHCVRLTL